MLAHESKLASSCGLQPELSNKRKRDLQGEHHNRVARRCCGNCSAEPDILKGSSSNPTWEGRKQGEHIGNSVLSSVSFPQPRWPQVGYLQQSARWRAPCMWCRRRRSSFPMQSRHLGLEPLQHSWTRTPTHGAASSTTELPRSPVRVVFPQHTPSANITVMFSNACYGNFEESPVREGVILPRLERELRA